MSWLSELFFGQGIAHSVLMFAIVIAPVSYTHLTLPTTPYV